MEDYNNENPNQEKNKHHNCWKKCLAMLIAAFLGGFLAIYFVADQIMERHQFRHFNPMKYEQKIHKDMEKMYKQDMKAFDDMFKMPHNRNMKKSKLNDFGIPVFMMDSVKIKTEYDDNKFNIIVCLKPFQGDENKVNYNLEGRKLTVFGSSQIKDKEYEQDISFSQDFILPENADTANITKVKDGNKLVISVPVKE